MAVGDIYRHEVYMNVGSEITMCVHHTRETVAYTDVAQAADEAQQQIYEFWDALKAELSEDWRVIQLITRTAYGTPVPPAFLILGGAENIVGAVESEIIPSTSALLISEYTLNPNRDGRGRFYVPGLPESSQNEGQVVEARYNAIVALVDTPLTAEGGPYLGGTGKFRFCVFGAAAPGATQHVNKVVVRPNLATQRRRRAHVGFA